MRLELEGIREEFESEIAARAAETKEW